MASSIHDMWYGKARTQRRPAQEILFTVGADGTARPVDPGVGKGGKATPVDSRVNFTAPYPGADDDVAPGGIPLGGYADVRGYHGAGVYGFSGDPDTATTLVGVTRIEAAARMQAAVVALRGALAVARLRVNATPSSAIGALGAALASVAIPGIGSLLGTQIFAASAPSTTKEATLNGLKILEGLVTKQESKIPEVLDGKLALSRWFAGTDPIRTGISSVLATLSEDSTAANLDATFVDAKQDLTELWTKLEAAGGAAIETVKQTYPLLLVGGLALGGFILYQYLTAPLRLVPKMHGLRQAGRRRARRTRRG